MAALREQGAGGQERIGTNTQRVAAALLHGLGTHLDRLGAQADGGDAGAARILAGLCSSISPAFGDPEGVRRSSVSTARTGASRTWRRMDTPRRDAVRHAASKSPSPRRSGGVLRAGSGRREASGRGQTARRRLCTSRRRHDRFAARVRGRPRADVRQRKRGREFLVRWVRVRCHRLCRAALLTHSAPPPLALSPCRAARRMTREAREGLRVRRAHPSLRAAAALR